MEKDELLELCKDTAKAIQHILDELKGIKMFEEEYNYLEESKYTFENKADELEEELGKEYAEELEEMNREYMRSVL